MARPERTTANLAAALVERKTRCTGHRATRPDYEASFPTGLTVADLSRELARAASSHNFLALCPPECARSRPAIDHSAIESPRFPPQAQGHGYRPTAVPVRQSAIPVSLHG